MSINWIIVITILALLGLERLVVTTTTKKPQFIKWYRKLPFLHPNGISVLRLPMGFIAAALAARLRSDLAKLVTPQ